MTIEHEQSIIAARNATDNAASQIHIVLRNTFDPLNTDQAAESQADYAKIAQLWEQSVQTFATRIKRSSESAWSGGAAAPRAQQSIAEYAADALNLTPALKELSTRVDDAITAVANTKKNLTPYSDDPQSWWNPGDWLDGNPEAVAEEKARKVVQEQYVAPIAQTDHKIPVLPKPKDPTNPTGGAADTGTDGITNGKVTNSEVTNGKVTNGKVTNGGDDTGSDGPPTGSPTETNSPVTVQSTAEPLTNPQSGGTATGSNTTGGNSTGTTPASTNPTGAGPTATNVPGTNIPGTGRSGSGGSGSGTSRPGGSGSGTSHSGAPGAGRSVSGTPTANGATGSSSANNRTTASASGRNGTPGMGGMGNRGGKGDDEDEHKIPDYLIQDRETELLGVQPRVLPPGGVIGG